jgi:surfeit locus 1 family protein
VRLREGLLLTVAAIVAVVCMRLGVWQLHRLEQRRAHNAAVLARYTAPPIELDSLRAPAASAFRRVRVRGSYDHSRELLLANRPRHGSPGVHVLTPLRRDENDTAVLIVRGWLYAPDAAHTATERWREGSATGDVGYVRHYAAESSRPSQAPGDKTVRELDFTTISSRMPYPLAPYLVVLISERDQTGVTPVTSAETSRSEHPVRVVSPTLGEGNHLSYAVQWFSFAVIAIIGGAVLFLRGRRGAIPYDADFQPSSR